MYVLFVLVLDGCMIDFQCVGELCVVVFVVGFDVQVFDLGIDDFVYGQVVEFCVQCLEFVVGLVVKEVGFV